MHTKNVKIFFEKLWQSCNLPILEKDDKRFTIEFTKDDNICNSTLLRIALLQNRPLEQWQIYKVLHSAIQRRGYDPNIIWANSSEDEKENKKELQNIHKMIKVLKLL